MAIRIAANREPRFKKSKLETCNASSHQLLQTNSCARSSRKHAMVCDHCELLRHMNIMHELFRQEKGAQRLTFRVLRPPGGVGGLTREGVVAKNFVPSLESLSSLGFERRNLGCPGIFAGMSRTLGGVQKVCATKSSCAFFVSKLL